MTTPTPAAQTASGSSFYTGMRILPRAQREAMFEIYSFCRAVDDIADDPGPREPRRAATGAVARRHRCALSRRAAAAARRLGARRCAASICSARTSSPSSTAWRWTWSPTSARRTARRSIFIATASPARSGGFRCGCSAWSTTPGCALAHHLGRALQLTNILRDLDEDAALGPALFAARSAAGARHHRDRSGDGAGASGARPRSAPSSSSSRRAAFSRGAQRSWRKARAAWCGRRASWARPITSF